MPENESRMVSAMVIVQLDGAPRTFSSTVTAMPGQEGLMLEMAWEQTRRQVTEALQEQKK